MRIGGIASGMDTEQMVQDLMRVERMRVDKLTREQEALEWQREAFNTTNKKLAEFILETRSEFGLSTTTSSGLILNTNNTGNFDWVKSASVSHESVLTATASANAMAGTHTIKVENIAEVASFSSEDISGLLNEDGTFKESADGDIAITTKNGTASFTIGSGEGKIDNINDLVSAINNAEDGDTSLGLRAAYDRELGRMMINTKEQGKEQFISIGGSLESEFAKDINKNANKYTFDSLVGGQSFNLNGEPLGEFENIDDLVNAINSHDNLSEDFYAYKSGEGLVIESLKGEEINLISDAIDAGKTVELVIQDSGKDAKVQFNGDTITKSSNNFSIYGVNYQLKSAEPGTEITVNVDTDVEGIVEKVTDFVDKYNELIDDINNQLKEKEYRDYQPLTSEEKQAMTENEIELWEERARSGLLRNDPTLTRTLQTMRSGLYESVYMDGSDTSSRENLLPGFSHLTELGITTGNYQSGGKLEIDETKLRTAINDNAEGVVDLLFRTSDTKVDEDSEDYAQQKAQNRAETGLVHRLFDDMITGMQEIVRVSGTGEDASLFRNVKSNMLIDFVTGGSISRIDRNIMNIGDRIAREERLLASRENRYWSQFTAMEKAMEEMNQQSGWLMAQLGQMY